MTPVTSLEDFDLFFFYGKLDIELENEHDLVEGIVQPKRSLFYNRQDGTGIQQMENHPNIMALQITIRALITMFVGLRNTRVSDGRNGQRERRLAVSQNSIRFVKGKQGRELDVIINYISFNSFDRLQSTEAPVGVSI